MVAGIKQIPPNLDEIPPNLPSLFTEHFQQNNGYHAQVCCFRSMHVTRCTEDDYDVDIHTPETVDGFWDSGAFRKYQRIDDGPIEYLNRVTFANIKTLLRLCISIYLG